MIEQNYIKDINNWLKSLFNGRLNRLNFLLGNTTLFIIAWIISSVYKILYEEKMITWGSIGFYVFYWLIFSTILLILILLINTSILVRRFHDLGFNGFIALLFYIPLVNIIILFIALLKPGELKNNKYGELKNKKIKYPYDFLAIK